MPARDTKERLRAGELLYGCFVRYPDPGLAELLALQGFDFLVLDGEHGTMEPRDCENMVRGTDVRGVPALVRVPANEPAVILRFMDTGALGVHVPLVSSADDAERAVRAAKYGPRGSAESVANIASALSGAKNTKAVLLENHGVLAFGADPAAAARANLIVEEAAQMAIFAEVLGGAKPIPPELLQATVGRRDEFSRAGIRRA